MDGRAWELTLMLARLGPPSTVVFFVLPLGMAFAFLGVQFAVFGIYLGASFAPNHVGMPVFPEGLKVDYLSKQVLSSRNIRGGRFATILFGGLNLKTEHHLFPSMPRPHLLRARSIVRQHCADQRIAYTEVSIREAYAAVARALAKVGQAAPDVFFCRLVVQYGRR